MVQVLIATKRERDETFRMVKPPCYENEPGRGSLCPEDVDQPWPVRPPTNDYPTTSNRCSSGGQHGCGADLGASEGRPGALPSVWPPERAGAPPLPASTCRCRGGWPTGGDRAASTPVRLSGSRLPGAPIRGTGRWPDHPARPSQHRTTRHAGSDRLGAGRPRRGAVGRPSELADEP